MTLKTFQVITPLGEYDDFNVTIETSDCATTSLVLVAKLSGKGGKAPLLSLPIMPNDTTRCLLDPGDYVFAIAFENVNAAAAVTIAVTTNTDPSTSPSPLDSPGAGQAKKGSYSFNVTVS